MGRQGRAGAEVWGRPSVHANMQLAGSPGAFAQYICVEGRPQAPPTLSPHLLDPVGKLSIRDQKRRDLPLVQLCDQRVDLGVHDGLAHQAQCAVPDLKQGSQI